MLRKLLLATLTAVVLLPAAPASAKIIEVGKTRATHKPSCPADPCLAVSRTTGFQKRVGAQRDPYTVPADGRIVAWTVTLGSPNKKQRTFFESNYGGPASAGVIVWRPNKKKPMSGRAFRATPLKPLRPYFGRTVQFPLEQTLKVKKGDIVALTVPTWAPVLAVGLPNTSRWRATRPANRCQDTQTQTAHRINQRAEYGCLYRTARLTYSATLITEPKPN
jgi:hypothetical protein